MSVVTIPISQMRKQALSGDGSEWQSSSGGAQAMDSRAGVLSWCLPRRPRHTHTSTLLDGSKVTVLWVLSLCSCYS